jgi:hypothetical protein
MRRSRGTPLDRRAAMNIRRWDSQELVLLAAATAMMLLALAAT